MGIEEAAVEEDVTTDPGPVIVGGHGQDPVNTAVPDGHQATDLWSVVGHRAMTGVTTDVNVKTHGHVTETEMDPEIVTGMGLGLRDVVERTGLAAEEGPETSPALDLGHKSNPERWIEAIACH